MFVTKEYFHSFYVPNDIQHVLTNISKNDQKKGSLTKSYFQYIIINMRISTNSLQFCESVGALGLARVWPRQGQKLLKVCKQLLRYTHAKVRVHEPHYCQRSIKGTDSLTDSA